MRSSSRARCRRRAFRGRFRPSLPPVFIGFCVADSEPSSRTISRRRPSSSRFVGAPPTTLSPGRAALAVRDRREPHSRPSAKRGAPPAGVRPRRHGEDAASLTEAGLDEALAAALLDLGEQDRNLILLYAWAELSYEQLSEALALPLGTVRSRLSRIRRSCQAALAARRSDRRSRPGMTEIELLRSALVSIPEPDEQTALRARRRRSKSCSDRPRAPPRSSRRRPRRRCGSRRPRRRGRHSARRRLHPRSAPRGMS